MLLIQRYDLQENFWELYPEFLSTKEFREFRKGDKTKGKNSSSSMMWAIAHYQAYNSPWANLSIKDRLDLCLKDVIKDPKAHLPKDLITRFEELQFDSERRYLAIWCKKVDELAGILENSVVTLENADTVQKMLMSCEKLLSQKDEVLKRLQKKQSMEKTSGIGNMSLLESGDL